MKDDGSPTPPPYKLVDNEYSILDKTDLVFIDPVGTGYSRTAPGEKKQQFHGVKEDVRAVGEFIRKYVTENKRWPSPKFLIGESYGTTRASGLASHLQGAHGMNLNGIMLVSAILNFQTARFSTGNDLPYPLFLPTYTATAWYHKALEPKLQKKSLREVLDEVEKFALGDYTVALMKGARLSDDDKTATAKALARYTGLTQKYVEHSNLRVSIQAFAKELLRDQREGVGRFDSRFKSLEKSGIGTRPDYDPSYSVVLGAYSATINHYLRDELKYETETKYEVLSGRVHPWSYKAYQNRYVNVSEELRSAMAKNPYLKVWVANGYYDLATPYLCHGVYL